MLPSRYAKLCSSSSGALDTTVENITSLAECVAKVKSCAEANYVSFSPDPAHHDCSWYTLRNIITRTGILN
jgi:hypothetical protein